MNLVPSQPIQPVEPIRSAYPRKQRTYSEEKGSTNAKVRGFFFHAIQQVDPFAKGALLLSTAAPRTVRELFSALSLPVTIEEEKNLSPKKLKRTSERKIGRRAAPLGLHRCRPHGWINALMQFLLFLPGMPELFFAVPYKFEPVREFAQQYFLDQEEQRSLSRADGASLLRCFLRYLPDALVQGTPRVDLYRIFRFLLEILFPSRVLGDTPFSQAALLRPDWHLMASPFLGKGFLENAMERRIEAGVPELFLVVQGALPQFFYPIKRQLFPSSKETCYDLDSFIEYQLDEEGNGIYLTYVKVEGTWYQCDDDRITAILSVSLAPSLQRGMLLHYKKLAL